MVYWTKEDREKLAAITDESEALGKKQVAFIQRLDAILDGHGLERGGGLPDITALRKALEELDPECAKPESVVARWLPNISGECPVARDSLVDVVFGSGTSIRQQRAGSFNWTKDQGVLHHSAQINSYRVSA